MIDLDGWAVTLPTADVTGGAQTVRPPQVATLLAPPWFEISDTGLHLGTPDGAAPGTQLREATPPWSTADGDHRLSLVGHADEMPAASGRMVIAGIYDGAGRPVVDIVVDGAGPEARGRCRVGWRHRGVDQPAALVEAYRLGDTLRLALAVADGSVELRVDGRPVGVAAEVAGDCRFTVGCLLQRDGAGSGAPAAAGRVTLADLVAGHRAI